MSSQITFVVEKENSGLTLHTYLRDKKAISEKSLRKLKSKGQILCNGEKVTTRKVLQEGDIVNLHYPPTEQSQYLFPQFVPLQIIFEDEDILVLNKGENICVHPTKNYPDGTLANGVLYHWEENNIKASFHIINRLDRDTSGLVLIAKNKYSAQQLFLQQEQQRLKRFYLALVEGQLENSQGTIDAPIQRMDARTTQREVHPLGQPSITYYTLVGAYQGYSLIRLNLETGRTHQIRVHMSYLGHPLVGDSLYGGCTGLFSRQFLHAYKLKLIHPRSKEELALTIDLPQDMQEVLKEIGSQKRG